MPEDEPTRDCHAADGGGGPWTGQRVCALVIGPNEALDRAFDPNEHQADAFVRASRAVPGIEQALATGADWIWLLDGSASAGPDTLPRLLSAALDLAPYAAPAVLSSRVVGERGRPSPAQLAWPRRGDVETALFAFEHHVVPIRAAASSSLLVWRAAAAVHEPPRDDLPLSAAVLGWTARILRRATGYLVPASTVAARSCAGHGNLSREDGTSGSSDPAEEIRGRLALISSSAWETRERLRLGAETARVLARALASRQAAPLPIIRAAARGVVTPA